MTKPNTILPAVLMAAVCVVPGLGLAQARDGSAANPPSDAVGRAVDRAAGRPTIPDGQPGNPPSTALGRMVDRVTGQTTSPDGVGNNPPGTAVGRALERAGDAVTSATGSARPEPARTVAGQEVMPGNRASEIIGANVYNEAGTSIGEVEDLIIRRDGSAPVAVVSVGGFLGGGTRLVAVPLTELRFAEDNQRWTLNGATKDSLEARPVVRFAAPG